jgi:hypothetical protein
VDAALSDGVMPGRLLMRTVDMTGTLRERMRVTSQGTTDITSPNAASTFILAGQVELQGTLLASGLTYPTSDGSAFDLLVTDGDGVLSFASASTAGLQTMLGFTPEDVANKSTSTSLGTSNTLYPSQNAVKVYVDTGLGGKEDTLGFTPENVANKATSTSLGTSNTLYPSQNAVKVYVDTGLAGKQSTQGAQLDLSKQTGSASAPGDGVGMLRWEAGTTAGTLKLVAYSGTSTTGVTIVDNVGSGNT